VQWKDVKKAIHDEFERRALDAGSITNERFQSVINTLQATPAARIDGKF
jgi:hypothetical protein